MNDRLYAVEYAVRRRTAPGWQIPTRTIGNREVVLVLSGALSVQIEQACMRAEPGTLLCFMPGISHSLRTDDRDPAVFCAVHFSTEPDWLPLPAVIRLRGRTAAAYLEQTVQLWNRGTFPEDWEANIAFTRFAVSVLREYEAARTSTDAARIAPALGYLADHPGQPVTLEELCTLCRMKKSALTACFCRVTGMPPVRYALECRLQYAREILCGESGLTVEQAAYRSGFSDVFYFSKQFRRRFGMPPGRFRDEV